MAILSLSLRWNGVSSAVCRTELDMPKPTRNLALMSVDDLLKLRDQIGATLQQKSRELQGQLQRLGVGSSTRGRSGAHRRKGTKVAPKYRGPDGETWAGRGA